jgi:pyruvate/2-oxoglutarate dehydrogenase complex dihydrolipoamide acyltransferase (E2) component
MVKFHWIRVAQERGVIKMTKIPTEYNYSDIMTKATGTGTFCRHVDTLMDGPAATAVADAAAVAKPAAEPAAEPAAATADALANAKPAAEPAATKAAAAKRTAASRLTSWTRRRIGGLAKTQGGSSPIPPGKLPGATTRANKRMG